MASKMNALVPVVAIGAIAIGYFAFSKKGDQTTTTPAATDSAATTTDSTTATDTTTTTTTDTAATTGTDTAAQPATSAEVATVLASGQVQVAPELLEKANAIGTVFVILRDESSGAPYAVKKLDNPKQNPFAFELTQENVMVPGSPAPEKLKLVVRFDADGNAGPEAVEDLVGEINTFAAGTKDVKVDVLKAGGGS